MAKENSTNKISTVLNLPVNTSISVCLGTLSIGASAIWWQSTVIACQRGRKFLYWIYFFESYDPTQVKLFRNFWSFNIYF